MRNDRVSREVFHQFINAYHVCLLHNFVQILHVHVFPAIATITTEAEFIEREAG